MINKNQIRNGPAPLEISRTLATVKSPGFTPTPKYLVRGFTLIELLVVIAIIGMLAGILLPTLQTAREKANRTVCMGNLKVIGEAFNMYNIDTGEMPPTPGTTIKLATNRIKRTIKGIPEIIGLGYFYDDPTANLNTDNYIEDFATFICPSSENYRDAQVLKQQWSSPPALSAYVYRAESGYPAGQQTLILSDAKPAIVMDFNRDPMSGVPAQYNHKNEYVNILFKNGNVKGVENVLDLATTTIPDDKILTQTGGYTLGEMARMFMNADNQQ